MNVLVGHRLMAHTPMAASRSEQRVHWRFVLVRARHHGDSIPPGKSNASRGLSIDERALPHVMVSCRLVATSTIRRSTSRAARFRYGNARTRCSHLALITSASVSCARQSGCLHSREPAKWSGRLRSAACCCSSWRRTRRSTTGTLGSRSTMAGAQPYLSGHTMSVSVDDESTLTRLVCSGVCRSPARSSTYHPTKSPLSLSCRQHRTSRTRSRPAGRSATRSE